ncbi:MAG: nitroreductase family protein [Candidatus Hydrothermarchaeales archaeon]
MRKTEYNVDPLFPNRWSPRAMSGGEISDEELFTLFEAARWAPSSNNNQPWRFLYAKKNTENWTLFFNFLFDGNKAWAKNAAVLIVMVSKKTFDHSERPAITHSFDTGSAWENLALQGSISGLVVHGMQGFDYEMAREELNVPDNYQVEAMAAVGRLGKKEDLPEHLQEREFPSGRKELSEIAIEGRFK